MKGNIYFICSTLCFQALLCKYHKINVMNYVYSILMILENFCMDHNLDENC